MRSSGPRWRIHPRRPHPPAGARDAGATLVEYALVVALIAVAIVGGIQVFEDSASSSLERRADRAGAPDLGVGSSLPATTAAPTTAAPSPGPSTTPVTSIAVPALAASATDVGGNKWIGVVTVTVTDAATSTVLKDVSVAARWNMSDGTTGSASCITGVDGACTMSTTTLKDRVGSATLTITAMSGTNVSYTSEPAPSIQVTAP